MILKKLKHTTSHLLPKLPNLTKKPSKKDSKETFSKSRFSKSNLTIFALVFTVIGGYFLYSGFAAVPATCTVTVNAGGNVKSALDDNASSGGVICLNAGTYSLSATVNKSAMTKVTAAPGVNKSQVTINPISLGTSNNVWIDNITAGTSSHVVGTSSASATNIKLTNIEFKGPMCVFAKATNANILIDSNTFGPMSYCTWEGRISVVGSSSGDNGITISNNEFYGGGSDGIQLVQNARGTVIGPGNYFHDITNCGSVHCDAIQPYGAINTTITDNYFKDLDGVIADFDCNGSPLHLINNVFDQGTASLQAGVAISGANGDTVVHNTFSSTTELQIYNGNNNCGTNTNVTLRDNAIRGSCSIIGSGHTINYNLTTTTACRGTNGVNGTPSFVGGSNPSTWAGWQLSNNSLGKNAASDYENMGTKVYAPPKACTVSDISPGTSFTTAINNAQSGDVLCLESGNYGQWNGTNKTIILTPETGATPSMSLQLNNVSGFTIDGLTITSLDTPQRFNVDNVTIKNSTFTGSAYFRSCGGNATNIVLDHNTHNNISPSLYEGRIHFPGEDTGDCGVTIQNSIIRGGTADGIQNGADGVEILNNIFADLVDCGCGPHTDAIQLYGTRNTLVKGNFITNTTSGIVSFDCCQTNDTIKNNILNVNDTNVFATNSHAGSTFTHNTVTSSNPSNGVMRYGSKVGQTPSSDLVFRDNIATSIQKNTGNHTGTLSIDHNLCKNSCGTGNTPGTPTYAGGASRATIADYALAAGSLGKGTASDGLDVGANISKVGFVSGICDLNATPANLNSQVSAAQAGQTICLASGSYGTWTGTNKSITITVQPGAKPVMALYLTTGNSNFTIDGGITNFGSLDEGINITGAEIVNYTADPDPHDITIKNTNFTGGVKFDRINNANITLDHNIHHDISGAVVTTAAVWVTTVDGDEQPSGITVKNSLFRDMSSDGIQTGMSMKIHNNELYNIDPLAAGGNSGIHTDAIQLYTGCSGTTGTEIIGNYIHVGEQLVGSFDGTCSNTIKHNIIGPSSHYWLILAGDHPASTVEHNTLIGSGSYFSCASKLGDGTSITKIKDNILGAMTLDGGGNGEDCVPSENHHNLCLNGDDCGVCPTAPNPPAYCTHNNIVGTPQFVGGVNPTTITGFALAPSSPGKNAASEGTDIGANVALVGINAIGTTPPAPTPPPPTPPPTPPSTPSPTLTLKASSSTIDRGDSVKLTWTTTNASSCSASSSPSTSSWSGTKSTGSSKSQTIANLTSTKTYTLTCSNSTTNTKKSVKVTVRQPVTGDLNSDRKINIFDLSILLSKYGTNSNTADINNDNTVNIFDLSILLSRYGG